MTKLKVSRGWPGEVPEEYDMTDDGYVLIPKNQALGLFLEIGLMEVEDEATD